MFRKEKKKGVEDLIEIENPNRVVKKNIKAKDADVNAKVELTRRERYSIVWDEIPSICFMSVRKYPCLRLMQENQGYLNLTDFVLQKY